MEIENILESYIPEETPKSKYNVTDIGERYFRKYLGSGTSHVSGKGNKVLPFCSPETSPSKVWTSNPNINGGINNNAELASALIKWYNEYGEIFSLDANILLAQAIAESSLKIWNYPPKAAQSTACGISQFIIPTLIDVIISNNFNSPERFSDSEIAAITKGIEIDTVNIKTITSILRDHANRPQLHQNVTDNPKIMVKAQFVYMNWISDKCDGLASSALFGYNRGPNIIKDNSYVNLIYRTSKLFPPSPNGNSYEEEGINYVYKIFKSLYDNFGYKDLNITDAGIVKDIDFYANIG